MYHSPGQLRPADRALRDAVRFALGMIVIGAVFVFAATVWVSTCQGATADSVACGAPQRTLLAIAAPAILFAGGLRALFRTHQAARRGEMAWAWQGAGWFLLTSALLVLMTSMPPLTGVAVLGR